MDYKWFLFGFEGRINRASCWLASLIILCCMIFALLLLSTVCGVFGFSGPVSINLIGISASIQFGDDGNATSLIPQIATTLMTLAFGWCYAAVSIRRLHDRNKNGWWVVPYIVATGLYERFGDRLGGSWMAALLGLAVFIAFLWGLTEMYGLRGTHGTNRFGPNPLGKQQSRPRSVQSRLRATTAWDPQGEIEMAPHIGSPPPGMHVKPGA
jgi:uncharacterized membrane protein YhaH (DUF805 family)